MTFQQITITTLLVFMNSFFFLFFKEKEKNNEITKIQVLRMKIKKVVGNSKIKLNLV